MLGADIKLHHVHLLQGAWLDTRAKESSLCSQLLTHYTALSTLNIPSLGRQRCLPSWGPRRTPWFFVISQLFDTVDYSNYVFWVSETIIQ